ncbi:MULTISPECIES: tRNA pseudouridine(13) synthase TruD [unclassified Nitratiruptor]|uniref:tRNA pseudouridine(13) synthase TruD n=1 Tax=unclassified Nitratiruptor TaxID=2624044 RepID=UPI001916B62B|nr:MULTISPECIES: tRNA pseudouridine(13) synthase TruD [unclassified Nitratiruptor]BCD60047.1 tRNA pseudouridine13 synthase [Nitratiruptor sp. YY08-10]BCD64464.1 tRNA pseudouridine13 synthase [Nitratiruptor sp. YY08-14]
MRSYLIKEGVGLRFRSSVEDFFVAEIPLQWKGKGGHLVLKIEKKGLSTWDLITVFKREFGDVKIGYAGLKDKHATTIQYISLHKNLYKLLKRFKHPAIKIIATTLHNKPISMGDLLGNRFVMRVHDVVDFQKLQDLAHWTAIHGMPNYFGHQRFGRDGLQKAKAFVEGDYFTKDKKMQKFLLFIYQSDLFNRWLDERVRKSSGYFKLLRGEVYRKGEKLFVSDTILQEPFLKKEIVPTGLLPGSKVIRSKGEAKKIETKYDALLPLQGERRDAIVYPKISDIKKEGDGAWLEFTLPKGSYATIFLENLAKKPMSHKGFI